MLVFKWTVFKVFLLVFERIVDCDYDDCDCVF